MNHLLARVSVLALCAAGALVLPGLARAGDAPVPTQSAMPTSLDGQIDRARALRLSGNLDEAAHSLAQIMLVAPDDVRVIGEYGKVLAQQGEAKDAVAYLMQAVDLTQDDWTLYSALGVAYDQTGNRGEARKAYEHALALKPHEPSVLNNYAVSRMLAGDYAGAKAMLEQAGGSSNPMIATNLERAKQLADMHGGAKTAPETKLASTAPAAKTDPGKVIMQAVPNDPLAGPVGKPHTAPANIVATKSGTAIAAPRSLLDQPKPVQAQTAAAGTTQALDPSKVIMQAVPKDPLAGPVKVAAKPVAPKAHTDAKNPVVIAKDASAKPSVKAVKQAVVAPPPPLRSAAD